jgi:hypothetical protein
VSASTIKGTAVALGITCALCVFNAVGGGSGGKSCRRIAREKKDKDNITPFYLKSLANALPINIRRISDVPAPIS